MTSTQIEAVTTTSTIQRSKESGLSASKQCDARTRRSNGCKRPSKTYATQTYADFMRITDLRVIADGAADDVERLRSDHRPPLQGKTMTTTRSLSERPARRVETNRYRKRSDFCLDYADGSKYINSYLISTATRKLAFTCRTAETAAF